MIKHSKKEVRQSKKIDRRGARGLDKTRSMAAKEYRVGLHKTGMFLKPNANYWPSERYLFKNQQSADRIWERQNRIFMKTFSRGQGSEQFNRNWCKESFLTIYLKMLVVKIENKKWNTRGTKKKLSRVMYMEVSDRNNPIFVQYLISR